MLTVCLKRDYNIFVIVKYILTLMLVAINAKLSFSMDKYLQTPKIISGWNISCSVDDGSISFNGNNWIFKTSKNGCKGGFFKQRAEISSPKALKLSTKAKYEFQSIFSIKSNEESRGILNVEKFEFFQIHDGRLGCAPPLSIGFTKKGKLRLLGDYKVGESEGQNCDRDIMFDVGNTVVRREGTEYKIKVVLDFDGKSAFAVAVYLNDKLEVEGKYSPPKEDKYFKSKYYYFKHGVYSENMFDYELKSQIQMKRIQ